MTLDEWQAAYPRFRPFAWGTFPDGEFTITAVYETAKRPAVYADTMYTFWLDGRVTRVRPYDRSPDPQFVRV